MLAVVLSSHTPLSVCSCDLVEWNVTMCFQYSLWPLFGLPMMRIIYLYFIYSLLELDIKSIRPGQIRHSWRSGAAAAAGFCHGINLSVFLSSKIIVITWTLHIGPK